ncbi:MAG: hypothetical protein ABI594_14640 [Ginsengibacter sp.]
MLNENPNNDLHWKNKLGDLEGLPGNAFNKEGSWDKLHERLHEKDASRKFVWLYAAAACFLIALLFPWFWPSNKENDLTKNNIQQNQNQKSNSVESVSIKKDPVKIISSIAIEKISITKEVKNKKIITVTDHKRLPVENIAAEYKKREFIEPQKISAKAPLDTHLNITAIVPEKQKLRVVHINELGESQEEASTLVRKTEIHSFQMKFANQEVFVKSPNSSTKTHFTIFSTKTSSN